MKTLILLFLSIFFFASSGFSQSSPHFDCNRKIKQENLKADFEILWNTLNQAHPTLYKYTSKEEFTGIYNKALNSIGDEMSQKEFYLLVSALVARVRCVHTRVTFEGYDKEYLLKKCKMFPFNIRYIDKKAYIMRNFSKDTTISKGSQVISINNIPFESIIDSMFQYFRCDGFIETYKIWVALRRGSFKYYYSEYVDTSQTYSLVLRDAITNKERKIIVDGITEKECLNFIKAHPSKEKYLPEKKLKLKLCPDSNLALLTIKSFHTQELKELKENFPKFLKVSFAEIDKSNVENLIIDIRDNQGGFTENALLLYAYLTQKEFDVVDYIEVTGKDFSMVEKWIKPKKSHTLKPKYVYKNCDGKYCTKAPVVKVIEDVQKPVKDHTFTKNVYVLFNGGSASACAFFAYAFHINKRGTTIGEETGANIDGFSSMGHISLTLPFSKLIINIPLNNSVFVKYPGVISGHGMMPDYYITPSLQDILEKKDTELNFTIDLIKRGR